MSENRTVPLYQRPGARGENIAGIEAILKAGDSADAPAATWEIRADSLGGLKPRPGDRCRGTDGVWWTVRQVGPLAGGAYPCTCDREGGQ